MHFTIKPWLQRKSGFYFEKFSCFVNIRSSSCKMESQVQSGFVSDKEVNETEVQSVGVSDKAQEENTGEAVVLENKSENDGVDQELAEENLVAKAPPATEHEEFISNKGKHTVVYHKGYKYDFHSVYNGTEYLRCAL